MEYLNVIGIKAQRSSKALSILEQNKKNETLNYVANAILDSAPEIMKANEIDIKNAIENNMEASLVDRLKLDENRIKSIADGIFEIIALEDPIGEILSMKTRPNGLIIGQKRVPLGVIGIIYESRPNVTADAFGLCFKTGNAVVLRGGSDAINSNKAIVKAIKQGLEKGDCPTDSIQLIEDISRETAGKFMKLHKYIDVLIPRGGAGLIKRVVEQSTIPIIETGTGNCHTYVDEFADIDMAIEIIDNAKTQRMGVCNACEALVVHGKISKEVIPLIYKRLNAKNIEIRGDKRAVAIQEGIIPATDDDYREEFHGEIISLKVVDSLDEAIDHINDYGTKHSDAIVTKDYRNSQRFLNEIDSASVYVNASTRFSDGNEFGFGAEIGISTQKLHARGPMGLNALTSSKYIIYGDGHIRS